jgi:hypothetical protein
MFMYMFSYHGKKHSLQADNIREAADKFYKVFGDVVPDSVHRVPVKH